MFISNELITGTIMGAGILWLLIPFSSWILPNRRWADLLIGVGLIFLIMEVQSGYVAGLATYASIVTTIGLRLWSWAHSKMPTPEPKLPLQPTVAQWRKDLARKIRP